MNYHHAWRTNDDIGRHWVDLDESCTDKSCVRDHYIVLPSSLWNDYGFLFDRLSVLGSRIKYVEMPNDE